MGLGRLKTAFILLVALCLVVSGCGDKPKESAADELEQDNTTQIAAMQSNTLSVSNVSDTLLGFIVPKRDDDIILFSIHGFLRMAESLGFPAKIYYASPGAESVNAVDEAFDEGCKGLSIWDEGEKNSEAIKRAAEKGIPVVVPYYQTDNEGVTANIKADLLSYTEEIAMGIAQRMVERECKAGKILVYGNDPMPSYSLFVKAIDDYYPQFNVGFYRRTQTDRQQAVEALAEYILWNRDIKGIFSMDRDGASVVVDARVLAQKLFRDNGPPESAGANATSAPRATPSLGSATPSVSTATSAQLEVSGPNTPASTPVPEGLIKSITISVAGYGLSEETIALMRNNDIYAFVDEPYYEAGAQAIMLLDRILRKESVPQTVILNMPIVRADTLDKYVLISEQMKEWFK